MSSSKSGESYGAEHLIERQMLLWNVRQKAHPPSPATEPALTYRFVTISRDIGSLGDDIARRLSERLGWKVYDREIVDCISEDRGVRLTQVDHLDERDQNLLEDTVQRLLGMAGGGALGQEEYHEALVRTVVSLAGEGEAILVGRGANFVLNGQPGLHIRVIAASEVRARRLSERWQVSLEDARRRMHQVDEERRSFIKHHFKQDVANPRCYDLVVNTTQISPDQAVEVILASMGLLKQAPVE